MSYYFAEDESGNTVRIEHEPLTTAERATRIRTIDVRQSTGAETVGYGCTVGEMLDDNAGDDEVEDAIREALQGRRGHIGGGAQPHVMVELDL